MSDKVPIIVPDLGESILEVTLIRWTVQIGDFVKRDQVIAEVTSEKSDVEIVSPNTGTIVEQSVTEGSKVQKKSIIGYIEIGDIPMKEKPTTQPESIASSETTPPLETSSREDLPPPTQMVSQQALPIDTPEKNTPKLTPLAQKMIEANEQWTIPHPASHRRIFSRDLIQKSVDPDSEHPVEQDVSISKEPHSDTGLSPLPPVSVSQSTIQVTYRIKCAQPFKVMVKLIENILEIQNKDYPINIGYESPRYGFLAPLILFSKQSEQSIESRIWKVWGEGEQDLLSERDLQSGEGLIWMIQDPALQNVLLPLTPPLKFMCFLKHHVEQGYVDLTWIYHPDWMDFHQHLAFLKNLVQRLND